ncbi:MAG: hypothetical protein IJ702_04015 [Fretibacterium sp.]|nr:hypothetical protein [Fretibacterium sp.]
MFELIRTQLYTPVVGDILDGMGRVHQFLPQAIQPIRDDFRLATCEVRDTLNGASRRSPVCITV